MTLLVMHCTSCAVGCITPQSLSRQLIWVAELGLCDDVWQLGMLGTGLEI